LHFASAARDELKPDPSLSLRAAKALPMLLCAIDDPHERLRSTGRELSRHTD